MSGAPSPELQQLQATLGSSSLVRLMDQVEELEQRVADLAVTIPELKTKSVAVHRWKPPQPPAWPAIYNVLPDAPKEILDTMLQRDLLQLRARVAVRHTDLREELRRWELMVDVFRAVVDPDLRDRQTITVSHNPKRTSMRWATDVWDTPTGRVTALCMEFQLDIPLDRSVPRTTP